MRFRYATLAALVNFNVSPSHLPDGYSAGDWCDPTCRVSPRASVTYPSNVSVAFGWCFSNA